MGKRTNTAVWLEKYNRWQINVQKDGKRRSFTSSKPGRTGQREANAKADAWLDDNIDSTGSRVDELLNEYLEGVKATTSASNYRKEAYHVDSFIRPAIGYRKISSITERDLQEIIDKAYRKKDKKTGETVERSKKTLTNIRATINAFLKMCRAKKITTLFPENLTIPKGARYKGTRILQPNDLTTLFSVDTVTLYGKEVFDDYINAYRFCVLTGLRPGEARALRWEDITGNLVQIRGSINLYNEETRGKNDNAIRGFVMSEWAERVIEAQRGISQGPFVFNIQSLSTFRHRWQKYCESNGIQPVSLYALRHTFVSIVKTLPEGEVKSVVGHSKSMDTFGTYGHEIAGEGITTARDINALFVGLIGDGE